MGTRSNLTQDGDVPAFDEHPGMVTEPLQRFLLGGGLRDGNGSVRNSKHLGSTSKKTRGPIQSHTVHDRNADRTLDDPITRTGRDSPGLPHFFRSAKEWEERALKQSIPGTRYMIQDT